MENLQIYNAVREVPENAKKEIAAGRLKGKTDINPMWRIKTLTEQFGPCGIGWKYEITDKHMERNPESAEIAAFVDINLYIKINSEWSAAIPGTGGSAFVAEGKSGLHMSDECYKMALTEYDKTPEDKKLRPTDVLDMPGADKANNKTLFVNALQIAGITNEQGAAIVKNMFGKDVKVNDLDEADFLCLLTALE